MAQRNPDWIRGGFQKINSSPPAMLIEGRREENGLSGPQQLPDCISVQIFAVGVAFKTAVTKRVTAEI